MNQVLPVNTVTDEEIRKLVIARLRLLSRNRKISIGGSGEYSVEELISRVQDNDPIGKKVVEIQLQYLQSLKDGTLLGE